MISVVDRSAMVVHSTDHPALHFSVSKIGVPGESGNVKCNVQYTLFAASCVKDSPNELMLAECLFHRCAMIYIDPNDDFEHL
jgi:hypothetical protein